MTHAEDRHNEGPEDAFLKAYWADVDAERLRPESEYVARFPGVEDVIRREMNAVARMIGPYRLGRELGHGGQARVFEAFDLELKRRVALKLLSSPRAGEAFARFEREAVLSARLDHPGICTVYATDCVDGKSFIAMKLIEGSSLEARIRGPRVRSPECESRATEPAWPAVLSGRGVTRQPQSREELRFFFRYFAAVAEILSYAHGKGVVHRDLKPANLMIQPDGSPVILDFGLARDLRAELPLLTQSGDVLGTPPYMSPEQIDGRRVDFATDIWSLGVTLYESLCGRRPFSGATRRVFMDAVLNREPDPPSQLLGPAVLSGAATLGRDLDAVLFKCLSKSAGERYSSAANLAADLAALAREATPENSASERGIVTITHLARSTLEGRVQRFRKTRISIGRRPDGDVVFHGTKDTMVSAIHAEIVLAGGQLFIRDKGSRNGTYVEGARVHGERALQSGQCVVLGPVDLGPRCRVEFESGARPGAVESTGILPTQSS